MMVLSISFTRQSENDSKANNFFFVNHSREKKQQRTKLFSMEKCLHAIKILFIKICNERMQKKLGIFAAFNSVSAHGLRQCSLSNFVSFGDEGKKTHTISQHLACVMLFRPGFSQNQNKNHSFLASKPSVCLHGSFFFARKLYDVPMCKNKLQTGYSIKLELFRTEYARKRVCVCVFRTNDQRLLNHPEMKFGFSLKNFTLSSFSTR